MPGAVALTVTLSGASENNADVGTVATTLTVAPLESLITIVEEPKATLVSVKTEPPTPDCATVTAAGLVLVTV